MVVLALTACDKNIGLSENLGNDEYETSLTFEEFRSLRALSPDFRLSEEEVRERAMDFMDLFELEQTKVGNSKNRQIEEIISVSGNGTLLETRSLP